MTTTMALIMQEADSWATAGRSGASDILHRPCEPD
jgi:hypothetical protein